jgi:5-methylcytosine-specific restriction endonuclease McrA
MQRLRQKRPRLKLSIEEYDLLRHRVLERDGWRCQQCGSSKDLHVHHLAKRSKLGDDALDNLITLCVICHQRQHHFPTSAHNGFSEPP